jgi:hypothetical protein
LYVHLDACSLSLDVVLAKNELERLNLPELRLAFALERVQ